MRDGKIILKKKKVLSFIFYVYFELKLVYNKYIKGGGK